MRPDDDVYFAGFERGHCFLLLSGGAEAAHHFNASWKSREPAFKSFEVLEGEDGRGREDGDLF
jgi:hypothetical protein